MIVAHHFVQNILIFIIFCLLKAYAYADFCRLPDQNIGTCIHINNCKSIHKNQNIGYSLALCKIDNTSVVCCPLPKNSLPDPKDGVCGKQFAPNGSFPNRIVGGEDAHIGEFPWHVLLIYDKPFLLTGYMCGGSLITSRHVLTAAHCVSTEVIPPTWKLSRVRLGEKDLNTEADCEELDNIYYCARPAYDVPIDDTFIHDSYVSGGPNAYDIAVIKMAQHVQFTEFVKPICLSINKEINTAFGTSMISGFGKNEMGDYSTKLIKAEVNIINHEACTNKYAIKQLAIQNTQICALGDDTDSCKGDSGGGLFKQHETSKIWYLIGIISFGTKSCLSSYPGVYVNVEQFIDWIIVKINQ